MIDLNLRYALSAELRGFTLDLISAYAARPHERWKKTYGVGRDMPLTADFASRKC